MSPSVLPVGNKLQVPIGNLPFGKSPYAYGVAHRIQDKDWSGPVKEFLDQIQTRRCARLNALVESFGGQTQAVERLDKSQAQLSQLMTGKKPIGESLARDIEYTAGKPFGWLDWGSDEDKAVQKSLPQDPLAKEILGMWPKLSTGDKRELIGRAAGWLQRRSEEHAEDYQRA